MKITLIYVAIFCLIGFMGCKKIKLGEVDVPFEIEKSVVVSGNDTAFHLAVLVNAKENAEFIKDLDKIQSVYVNKITYRFSDFEGNEGQEVLFCRIDVLDTVGVKKGTLADYTNVKIAENTAETEIPVIQSLKTAMELLFKDEPHKVILDLNGALKNKPVHFTIKIKLYLKKKIKVYL